MRTLATIGIMLFTAAALNAACKNGNTQAHMDKNTTAVTAEDRQVSVRCIKDNKNEHKMPLSLFGDIPQKLIDSLGIKDGIPSSMNAFLINSDGKTILFDTGLGSPDSQLLAALDNKPEDIRYIYLTHMHGDHIGGMMRNGTPVFANAEVYVSRLEYEAWMNMSGQSGEQARQTMKAYSKRLHLFEYGDTLPGNVIALDGRGHTPGHTVYNVSGKVLVAGDIIHGMALQLANPDYCAKYDMDAQAAIQTRKRILKYAADNKIDIAGMHIPQPGIISYK